MADARKVGLEARKVGVSQKPMESRARGLGADVQPEGPMGTIGKAVRAIGVAAKRTAATVMLAAAVGTGVAACHSVSPRHSDEMYHTDSESGQDTATVPGPGIAEYVGAEECEQVILDVDTYSKSNLIYDFKTGQEYMQEIYADSSTALSYPSLGHPPSSPFSVTYFIQEGLPEYTDGAQSKDRFDNHRVSIEFNGEQWAVAGLGGDSQLLLIAKESVAGPIAEGEAVSLPNGQDLRITKVISQDAVLFGIANPFSDEFVELFLAAPGDLLELDLDGWDSACHLKLNSVSLGPNNLPKFAEISVYSRMESLADGQRLQDGTHISLFWSQDSEGVMRLHAIGAYVPDEVCE